MQIIWILRSITTQVWSPIILDMQQGQNYVIAQNLMRQNQNQATQNNYQQINMNNYMQQNQGGQQFNNGRKWLFFVWLYTCCFFQKYYGLISLNKKLKC